MTAETLKTKSAGSALKKLTGANFFGSIIIVVVMLVIMLIIRSDYLSAQNVLVLSKVMAVTAAIGFSQMIIISCGGLNLSIGSTGALSAIICGWAMTEAGMPWGAALLLGFITALVCGIVNGLLIYRAGGVGVAFFLTTLATNSIFTGIYLTITQGKPFYGPGGKFPEEFLAIGNTRIGPFPTSLIIVIAVAIVLAFMYSRLPIGRQILAFGANNKAAELYGVSKFKVVFSANVIAGILAGLAGILAMIRIEAAQPNMGSDWMLMSFAAPLIGGTRNEGGEVSVLGAVLGAFALTIISNALIFLKVDVYWNELIYGVVIILAVAIDRLRYIKK